MILTDRKGNNHIINPALLKDIAKMTLHVHAACGVLFLDNLKSYLPFESKESTLEESRESLILLMMHMFDSTNNVDLVMMKQALTAFVGLNYRYDKIPNNEMFIIKETDNMIESLEVGTKLTARDSKEYTVYSYLMNEYEESLELLSRIDILNVNNNINDKEAEDALLEIIYRALNKKVTKTKILKFLDAEFAKDVVRIYFDLPCVRKSILSER